MGVFSRWLKSALTCANLSYGTKVSKIGAAGKLVGISPGRLWKWGSTGELLPARKTRGGARYCFVADLPGLADEAAPAVCQEAIGGYYAGQGRRPLFRGKSRRLRFRGDNGVGVVNGDGNRWLLPGKMGGGVKMAEAMRWPGNPIRECRISERGGDGYASIRQVITRERYGLAGGTACIDLGWATFVTVGRQEGSWSTKGKGRGGRLAARKEAGTGRR